MTTRGKILYRTIATTLLIFLVGATCAADPGDREAKRSRGSQQGQSTGQKFTPDERGELRELRRERMRERFNEADQDGDRALSKDEAARFAPRLHDKFDNIDSNRDGRASADEIRAFRRERAKLRRIEQGGTDPRF